VAEEHACANCDLRAKAEARPRSLIGILWRVHSWFCPGWRSYQKSLGNVS
jgi:hypothetical protein